MIRKRRRTFLLSGVVFCGLLMAAGMAAFVRTAGEKKDRWVKLLAEYQNDPETDRLIFVRDLGKSRARLEMYKKLQKNGEDWWLKILSCGAYTGKNGMNKEKEGDQKTPTGIFPITAAFGIKKDPGTELPYTEVNEYLYWSEEEDTYNQLVDVRTLGREKIKGEHLIDCSPAYNYAIVIGYNQECVYGKGSAIFLHAKGKRTYTAGCVAVSQANMKRILKNATLKTKICIY